MIRKNILLVEYDAKSQYALQSVLQDLGHSVSAYFDFEEAESFIQHFNLAIIDVRRPGQQALEFAAAFKERNPHGRIVFITACDTLSPLLQTVSGSMVLMKPIDMELLAKLL
jgi:CheY-like chemotaxis protein